MNNLSDPRTIRWDQLITEEKRDKKKQWRGGTK